MNGIMKKALGILILLAVMGMNPSVSPAEELSSLPDEELTELYVRIAGEKDRITEQYKRITEEIERRYTSFWQEYPQGITPAGEIDTNVLERVTLFFRAWYRNSPEDMLSLCASGWKEKTEEPGAALLGILPDRTPVNMQILAVFGRPEDTERTVAALSIMDRKNGLDGPEYLFRITLRKEGDGAWYIDPESLPAYEELWNHDAGSGQGPAD